MPFESKAQQRYAFATKQPWAKEFAKHTPNMKGLPEHKAASKSSKARRSPQATRRRSK